MSDFKKKEIADRYVVNTVKHMIEDEERAAAEEAESNRPINKLKDKLTKRKLAIHAVMESAALGEITPEEEMFLLDAIVK